MAGKMDALTGFGLTQNEAKIYLALLQYGKATAASLAGKTGIHRRVVYDTMIQLEKKGIVGRAEIDGVTTYAPSPPSSMLSALDEKRDAMEKALPDLSRAFEQEGKTVASVMYGAQGIKTVLEDILTLRADYSVYYGQLQIFDHIPEFFQIFNQKRAKMGIKARYLLLDVPKARKRSKLVPFADIKFIGPSALSAGVWWVYADRVVLFVLENEQLVILIKNAALAKTFQQSFDNLFSSTTGIRKAKRA